MVLTVPQAIAAEESESGGTVSPTYEYTEVWVPEGDSGALGTWSKLVNIPASAFADARVGDVIRVNFDLEAGEDLLYQLQVIVKSVEEKRDVRIETRTDIAQGYYCYTITGEPRGAAGDTDLAMLHAHGLYLKGQYASVRNVEIGRETNTGISEMIENGFNSDVVEYYSIDGRKVSVPGKGIYIRVRNGKSQKVIF